MSHAQVQLLRELHRSPRRLSSLAAEHDDRKQVKRNLMDLEDLGYTRQATDFTWWITGEGVLFLKTENVIVPSRSFVSYSQKDMYCLPTWPNNRAGSNAHQSIQSRGVSC